MEPLDPLPVPNNSLAAVYAYMSSVPAGSSSSDSGSSHHSDISKRPASPDFQDDRDRKRPRDTSLSAHDQDTPDTDSPIDKHSPRPGSSTGPGSCTHLSPSADAQAIIDDLSQELECGCCSALVYRPVIVNPCQHFFCGSCCVLWVKNGGTNCPACRSVSNVVSPSRALQAMVDVLLRAAPHLERTPRERAQADELYLPGRSLRIPIPREPSPEPNIDIPVDFIRPCPHCNPSNPYGWVCPNPVPEPDNNSGWRTENGTPPGHGYCGNCEGLLSLSAPSTSKCDFCQISFCGINVQGRCSASPLRHQRPQNMSDVTDLIQSTEVYECFEETPAEVERMFDYLKEREIMPFQIYREIIDHIQETPPHFAPLIEQELFADLYNVGPGIGVVDPDPTAPRNRICRLCAKEVLLYGLKDWWERVRSLEASIAGAQDTQENQSDEAQMATDSQLSGSQVSRGSQNSITSSTESTSTTSPTLFSEQPSLALPARLPSLAELGFPPSFPYSPSPPPLRRTPSGQEQGLSSNSSVADFPHFPMATSSNNLASVMNVANTSAQMSPATSQDAVETMLSPEETKYRVFARALRRRIPDEVGDESQLHRHLNFSNSNSDNELNNADISTTTDYSSSSRSSVLGSESSGRLELPLRMSDEARDREREQRLEALFGVSISGDGSIPTSSSIGINPFNLPPTAGYMPLPLMRAPIMDDGMSSGMGMGMDE